jgi:NAD(P)-dependent dehydrogenase (short-subunit alcohol dehydrogenase family)
VVDRLGGAPIDALVLNAGLSPHSDSNRTADGFETTFAVNHLAHYLLLRLLMPHLAPRTIVVLTTSSTHDPAAKTILPAPRHADAQMLAHPDRDPQHDAKPRAVSRPGRQGPTHLARAVGPRPARRRHGRALARQRKAGGPAVTATMGQPGPARP